MEGVNRNVNRRGNASSTTARGTPCCRGAAALGFPQRHAHDSVQAVQGGALVEHCVLNSALAIEVVLKHLAQQDRRKHANQHRECAEGVHVHLELVHSEQRHAREAAERGVRGVRADRQRQRAQYVCVPMVAAVVTH